MTKPLAVKFINFYPPLWGAGIRVTHIADDYSSVDVEMKLTWWNKNVVGTQFGGSLYAMTDPFFMLLLMGQFGRDYIVWDKAANIRFLRAGRSKVTAHFAISREQGAEIKKLADERGKYEPVFTVDIIDTEGTRIAQVEKTLYVRPKSASKR